MEAKAAVAISKCPGCWSIVVVVVVVVVGAMAMTAVMCGGSKQKAVAVVAI